MKANLLPTIAAAGAASASRIPAAIRDAALSKRRPPGKFRFPDIPTRKLQSGGHSTIDGYSCFRDLQGTADAVFDLEAAYPDLVSIADIGDSYLKTAGEGGRDIYAAEITASASADRAQVLLTAGHHPREYAPPELLLRFAERLLEGYGEEADATWILDTTQINIVFHANPDGRSVAETERDLLWRKNVNPNDGTCPDSYGTDLNRNYDWMWGDTSEGRAGGDPCDEDYRGAGPLSEPESRAVAEYAATLFPEGQRKADPVAEADVAYGEEITGIFMDVHSYGGLTYYPWGHEDAASPDNDSLEAAFRKVSYFNGYRLWAGGHPDFLYPVSGDCSDYMYAHLGVASGGLEIGDDFYQDCDAFESTVSPDNLNALMYVVKLAKRPNALAKGPDVLDLSVSIDEEGVITASAEASDSELVNIQGYDSFATGEQTVTKVEMYVDVLPDEYGDGDVMYLLQPGSVAGSERVFVETEISAAGLASGRHVLYAVATDSDGYVGPITSVFFDVEEAVTSSPTGNPTLFTPETTTTTFTTTTGTTEISVEMVAPTNEPSAGIVTGSPTVKETAEPSNVPEPVVPTNNPIAIVTDAPMTVPTPPPANMEMTTEPSNKPSIAPVAVSLSNAAPVSLSASPSSVPPLLSSEDMPTPAPVGTASARPSTSAVQTVDANSASIAPTQNGITPVPTSTAGTESGEPTLSQSPSGADLRESTSHALIGEEGNAAFGPSANSGLIATTLLLLLNCIW